MMPPSVITTRCASCRKAGPRDKFRWMAHLDFCVDCMQSFVVQGWAVRKEGSSYTCTPSGIRQFPGLEVVSHCPRDGMPIYRRWINPNIASEAACPYCLGQEANMSKHHYLRT